MSTVLTVIKILGCVKYTATRLQHSDQTWYTHELMMTSNKISSTSDNMKHNQILIIILKKKKKKVKTIWCRVRWLVSERAYYTKKYTVKYRLPYLGTWLEGVYNSKQDAVVTAFAWNLKSVRVPKRTGGYSDVIRNAVIQNTTKTSSLWCTHTSCPYFQKSDLTDSTCSLNKVKSNIKTKKTPKREAQLFEGPSVGNGGRRWGGKAPGGGKPETWDIRGGALGGGGGIPGIPPGGGGGMPSVCGRAPRLVIRGGGRLIVAGTACPTGGGISFSILKWNWRKN